MELIISLPGVKISNLSEGGKQTQQVSTDTTATSLLSKPVDEFKTI